MRDIRFGIRMFAKSPGFTAIAVLTLALGIGGSATVCSWIRGLLLDPLPGIPRAAQLVAVETVMPNGAFHTSSSPDFRDFRDQNKVFSGLAGFELMPVDMTWAGRQEDRRVWGEIVTENYFRVLGVHAARGRLFDPRLAERGPGGDPLVILSYSFWRRQFGGVDAILGRTIVVNRRPFTVIGIAPKDFQGTIVGSQPDFWVPMTMQPVVLPGKVSSSVRPASCTCSAGSRPASPSPRPRPISPRSRATSPAHIPHRAATSASPSNRSGKPTTARRICCAPR